MGLYDIEGQHVKTTEGVGVIVGDADSAEEVEAVVISEEQGINWEVRLRSKWFWVAIIPMLLLLIQQVASIAGITLDFEDFQAKALAIVETVFMILGICGVIVDPTTKGFKDSAQAMTYERPRTSDDKWVKVS
jgi:phi LC3 family holin